MKGEFSHLPKILAEIAEVVGLDAAMAIAKAKGGGRASFPVKAGEGHWLVTTVGRKDADKLCKHFSSLHAGAYLHIPLGPQHLSNFYQQARLRALEMRARGASIAATARAVGVTTRAVEKWTAAAKAGAVPTRMGSTVPPQVARRVNPAPGPATPIRKR